MSNGMNYSQEQFEQKLRDMGLELAQDGRTVRKRKRYSGLVAEIKEKILAPGLPIFKETWNAPKAGAMQRAGRRTIVEDGFKFPSEKEAARYRELRRLRDLGMVRNIEPHPWWDIVVNNIYIRRVFADFAYEEHRGVGAIVGRADMPLWVKVVEDVKAERRDKVKGGIKFSTDTSLSKHGRRLVLACFGIEIKVIK